MSVCGELNQVEASLRTHCRLWTVSAFGINQQADGLAEPARLGDVIHDALERNTVVALPSPDVGRGLQCPYRSKRRLALHLLPPCGVPVRKAQLRKPQRERGAFGTDGIAVVLCLPLFDPAVFCRRRASECEAKARR